MINMFLNTYHLQARQSVTALENDLSEKNAEISLRMDNLSETIHNLSEKMNGFDNSTYQ